MNIINDNTFNLHNSLLNNDNRFLKVTLKSKQTGVARKLISADYHEFQTYLWPIRRRVIFKDIFSKNVCFISRQILFIWKISDQFKPNSAQNNERLGRESESMNS